MSMFGVEKVRGLGKQVFRFKILKMSKEIEKKSFRELIMCDFVCLRYREGGSGEGPE